MGWVLWVLEPLFSSLLFTYDPEFIWIWQKSAGWLGFGLQQRFGKRNASRGVWDAHRWGGVGKRYHQEQPSRKA